MSPKKKDEGAGMLCTEFFTCNYYDCQFHPQKNNNECTACIEKNFKRHEIPACFFYKIGAIPYKNMFKRKNLQHLLTFDYLTKYKISKPNGVLLCLK